MEKTLMMKKVILLILGIWDAVMAFLSPLWIAVAAICFSGRIHLLMKALTKAWLAPWAPCSCCCGSLWLWCRPLPFSLGSERAGWGSGALLQ